MFRIPSGSVDPARDMAAMDGELLLNDLIAVERKLERLVEERKKGGTDKVLNERQTVLFTRLHEILSAEKPLRGVEISAEEEKLLSGFGLLTRKPLLVLLNLGEGRRPPDIESVTKSPSRSPARQTGNGNRPTARGRCSRVHAGIWHHRAILEPHDQGFL